MPINSSSIPALRVARAVRRRKRAEGGAVFPDDIKRVYMRPSAPVGADESMMPGLSDAPAGNEGEVMPKGITNPIYSLGKSLLYDLPKKAMEAAAMPPGLRREDFTDVPPDTSPDPKSAFGGIGVDVPKAGWQPNDPLVGAALETAGNMAGASTPFIQKNSLGIFGGRLAQTADHQALARAEKMTAEGVAPEVIWKDTGWFKGPDDKWRFEIDDSTSGYKRIHGKHTVDNYPISTPHTVEAGAAYQHPNLYAAYPDLEKMPMQFRDLDGARGQYSYNPPSPGDLIPPHEAISLQTPLDRYGDNMKQVRSTTLHELQHAVQQREGFVPGGSPAEMQALVDAKTDARNLQSLGRMQPGLSQQELLTLFEKDWGRPPHPAANKIAQEMSPEDLARVTDNPMEVYRRLHGEVEARNVQTRQDLPDVGRANIFPRSTEDVLPDLQTLGRGRPGRATDMSEIDGLLEAERKLAGASDGSRPTDPAAGPAAAADPIQVGPGGGGAAGSRSLPEAQATAARWAGDRKPLEGLPGPLKIGDDYFVPGPIGKISDVAEDFMRTVHPDRPYTPPTKYHPIDPEHSQAIAKAYEEMKHTPNDPATKASYDALIDETAKQYEAIKKTGLKIEPIPAGAPDPYAANPRLAAVDVAENNHLWFFPTEGGFGTVNKITDNPMLRKTGEKIGDHELLANDMFRVVHDYFGHLKQGYGFRAAGEDNAWRMHSQMYSDLARPAMTTETRGQNSWVNYGPHGDKNRTASGADTIYADQKVGLMPEWTMRDRGSAPPIMVYHGSPHYFRRADIGKIGTGEGAQVFGHGLYFAGIEPVGEWYRHQLATRLDPLLKKYKLEDVGHVIGAHLSDVGGDASKLAAQYAQLQRGLIEGGETDKATKNMIAEYSRRIDYLNSPKRATGYMYQFGIDVDPKKLLDYDVSFANQSQHVQGRVGPDMEASVAGQIEAIKKKLQKGTELGRPFLPSTRAALEGQLLLLEQTGASTLQGSEIYKRMGLPAVTQSEGAVRASQRLLGMDVPGFRYKDAGSRAPGQKGSHNYVMFGDNMLRLLKQYGVVGIPAAGVMGVDGEERRARGGRVARRLARKKRADGGEVDWSNFNKPFGEIKGTHPDDTPVKFQTKNPLVKITEGDIDRGMDVALGAATIGGPAKGLVRRVADDAGSAMTVARKAKAERMYAEPEYTSGGHLITNKGVENPPNPMIQTVADPYRMMYPGVYRNPRILAEEAAARVGPEDEAMKRLFGVTRGDLREMSKGRVGNEDPRLNLAKNPKGSLAAQNIQTPQNTQRLVDILGEAGKHEGLRTADAWYNMDPVFKRMVELFGPDEAVKRYQKFNTTTAMASPGSDVMTEIQRGTAAHWLQNQGRFDDFKKFAGVPEEFRSRTPKFPGDMRYIGGHPYHRTSQSDPMQKYFDAGSIQSKEPKVPLYAHASGTPETGFQTSGPVGDAHFSRGVGLSDTRKGPTDVQGSFSRAEYQTLQPWWQHEVAGKVGLESVPGQARLWTALGPQTGVDSALGAPKLELLAQQIMVAAKRLRISPEQARDLILSGKAGAGMLGGAVAAPVVADQMRERSAGGGVDAAMEVARNIKRAKGGRVHVGPIVGATGGRADKRPMEVPDGAYVLTADHVSGLGEGNTEAGMKKLSPMFPKSKPSALRKMKSGGAVPIYAADGEFVIHPDDIIDRFGDLDYGHRSLDAWQTAERKELIKTLKNLAPPAQD